MQNLSLEQKRHKNVVKINKHMALAEELKTSVEIEDIKVKPKASWQVGAGDVHVSSWKIFRNLGYFFFMFEQYFGRWYFIHTCLCTRISLFLALFCDVLVC